MRELSILMNGAMVRDVTELRKNEDEPSGGH